MVKKDVTTLPNPEAKRLPIVPDCLGGEEYETLEKGKKVKKVTDDCTRIFELSDGTKVCCAYENPAAVCRLGCGLGDNKPEVETAKGMTLKRKFKRSRF
jgi:hypothetical protein